MNLDSKIPEGPLEQKWDSFKANMKLINPSNKRKYKILVVGTGLAGASAAASLAELGYQVDPSWGQPLKVTGRIRHVLDGDFIFTGGAYGGTTAHMGLSAVLAIGPIEVLVMSRPTYDWDDEQFRAAGLDVRSAKFIGAKNPMNFNFAYRDIAKAFLVVDTPGPTPATMLSLPYKRMQRPFFPLDDDIPGIKPTVFVNRGLAQQ